MSINTYNYKLIIYTPNIIHIFRLLLLFLNLGNNIFIIFFFSKKYKCKIQERKFLPSDNTTSKSSSSSDFNEKGM